MVDQVLLKQGANKMKKLELSPKDKKKLLFFNTVMFLSWAGFIFFSRQQNRVPILSTVSASLLSAGVTSDTVSCADIAQNNSVANNWFNYQLTPAVSEWDLMYNPLICVWLQDNPTKNSPLDACFRALQNLCVTLTNNECKTTAALFTTTFHEPATITADNASLQFNGCLQEESDAPVNCGGMCPTIPGFTAWYWINIVSTCLVLLGTFVLLLNKYKTTTIEDEIIPDAPVRITAETEAPSNLETPLFPQQRGDADLIASLGITGDRRSPSEQSDEQILPGATPFGSTNAIGLQPR